MKLHCIIITTNINLLVSHHAYALRHLCQLSTTESNECVSKVNSEGQDYTNLSSRLVSIDNT